MPERIRRAQKGEMDMKDFAGKVAFITGGASGVGLGQAKVFSEAGMKLVIADVRQDHLDDAAAYFKDKNVPVHFIKLDVTDRPGWAAAADETERVYGTTPDLLIQTAGVNVFGPVEASTFEDFDWVMGVNFYGVVNGLVTFVPRMIKAGRGGYIVTTVSGAAFGGAPAVAQYACSKAATLNVMESYYQALKPYGIGVSALMPANIRTNIHDGVLYTRPEHLKNTGYNVTEESQALLFNKKHSFGTDPYVFAQRLKAAIEDEIFLVIPYPSGTQMVIEGYTEKYPLYTTLEGMKELEDRRRQPPTEERKRRFFETENYHLEDDMTAEDRIAAGFGMAKKEIDWIDESKRMK